MHFAADGRHCQVVSARAFAPSAVHERGVPFHHTVHAENVGPRRQTVSRYRFGCVPLAFTRPPLKFRLTWGDTTATPVP